MLKFIVCIFFVSTLSVLTVTGQDSENHKNFADRIVQQMNDHGHYIVQLSQKINSLSEDQLLKQSDKLLDEINVRRSQIQVIREQIHEFFNEHNGAPKLVRSDLELALYNCDNFDNLSGDFLQKLQK